MRRWMALPLCLGLLTGCESVTAFVDDVSQSIEGFTTEAPPPSAQLSPAASGTAQAGTAQTGAAAPQPAAIQFPPAPLPRYSPGDTFTYEEAGQTIREQVLTTTAERVVWTNEAGTVWTTLYDVTSPVLSWSGDPELGRGKQTIEGPGPKLFPLGVGKESSFIVSGQSENRPNGWRVQHSCKVVGASALEVKAGRFFTYEIVCQRPDHIETIYYAPAAMTYARRIRAFDKVTVTRDLVDLSLVKEMPLAEMTPFQNALATLDGEPMPEPVMRKEPKSKDEMMASSEIMKLEKRIAMLEKKLDDLSAKPEMMADGKKEMKDGGQKDGKKAMKDGAYGLHLASYRTEQAAKRGWTVLTNRFKSELSGLDHKLMRFKPKRGGREFVRLIAIGFPDKAAADKACRPVRTKRQFCQSIKL